MAVVPDYDDDDDLGRISEEMRRTPVLTRRQKSV
jgi:hypothetical protein